MKLGGGCHCKAVRYSVEGEPEHAALCHCSDCRASSGAPMVAWAAFPTAQFKHLAGEISTYNGHGASVRHFCPTCGTGLWFVNEQVLPGLVDIQVSTLDDPEALPPTAHIQTAERVSWMANVDALPAFERFPGG